MYAQVKISLAISMFLLATFVFVSGCSLLSSLFQTNATLTITASAGTITGSGSNWSFDAGQVPQYTTEAVTFTVTNTSSVNFSAQKSVSFTNSDFTTNLNGSFTVNANSSNTFVGYFTPTNSSGEETGEVTLTSSSGTPVSITIKGITDSSFEITDESDDSITQSMSAYPIGCGGIFYLDNYDSTAVITEAGSPDYVSLTGSGASAFEVTQQPTGTLSPASSSDSFQIETFGNGTATVNIAGTSSVTGANFTFSFPITHPSGGC